MVQGPNESCIVRGKPVSKNMMAILPETFSISEEGSMKIHRSTNGGSNVYAAIISMLFLSIICFILPPDLYASQSAADLAGTWNINTLASGPGAPFWFRGRITVNPDGSFSGTGQDYGEAPNVISGSFGVASDGSITVNVDANAVPCRIDVDLNVMVCTETWAGDGTSNLIIMLREAALYSLVDLTGEWEGNILVSGLGTYNWERGSIKVNPDGTFTLDSVDATGSSYITNDSLAITPEGLITIPGMPTAQCRMNMDKTVFICTDTWSDDGSAILLTFVKKEGMYTMADVAGQWYVHGFASGPGAPWWERGTATINPDGSFTARIEDYDGTTNSISGNAGSFSCSPDGIVNISGVGDEFQCAMNSAKKVLICTGTWLTGDPGTTEMKVLIKRVPCTYAITSTGKSMTSKGGSTSVNVTAVGDSCSTPVVAPSEGWITAGVTKWAKNKGSIKVTVSNNSSSIPRSGSVMIEGRSFVISQQGQMCVIQSVSPSSQAVPVTEGLYSFQLTIGPNDCSWTVSTTSAFLQIPDSSGTGTTAIDYIVDPNTTGKARSGKITVLLPSSGKKKSFSVKQAAK